MRETAVPLFYEGSGKVRAVTVLTNTSLDASNPGNTATGIAQPAYLDDPYEGELLVLFMDMLANWSGYADNGAHEKDLIWERKLPNIVPRNYTARDGTTITVQQGYWFSSHEQWKLMVLPYLELPLVRQVFTNAERVRLTHAVENHIPGLFASSHAPPDVDCGTLGGYCNAVGIQDVASQVVEWDQSVSPYGAYPAILVDRGAGLAWYNTMLSLPHMQTEAGSVESSNIQGTSVAPVLTWDTKTTTVLAMLGGTGPLLSRLLDQDKLLQRFKTVVGGMYEAAFRGKFAPGSENQGSLPLPPQGLLPLQSLSQQSSFQSCSCNASAATPVLGSALAAFGRTDVHV